MVGSVVVLAKRRRVSTARTIERKIKEGRGQGHFSDYKPWLTIHDVPSQGIVTRIRGWKSNRLHHLLSEHYELAHFYQLEWAHNVIDIREQYPLLPLERTLFIAERLGIKHPIDPKTQHPIVMTTDMLLTIKDGGDGRFEAHSIKPISKLGRRVLEKLQLEKAYFKELGINWTLITERQINYNLVKNVEWLHSSRDLGELYQFSSDLINLIEPTLYRAIKKEDKPLSKITRDSDLLFGLSPGSSIQLVKHMIANRYWLVDMEMRIQPTLDPLKILETNFLGGGVQSESIC